MLHWLKKRCRRHAVQTVVPDSSATSDYKYGSNADMFQIFTDTELPSRNLTTETTSTNELVNHIYEDIATVRESSKSVELAYAITSLSELMDKQFGDGDCKPCSVNPETTSSSYQTVEVQRASLMKVKVDAKESVSKQKGIRRHRWFSKKLNRLSTRRISVDDDTSTSSVTKTTLVRGHSCFPLRASRKSKRVRRILGTGPEVACEGMVVQNNKVMTPSRASCSDGSSEVYDDSDSGFSSQSSSESGRSRQRSSSLSSDDCIENPLYEASIIKEEEVYVFRPQTGFGMNRWYRQQL